MYKSIIDIKGNKKRLLDCFLPEAYKRDRAQLSIKETSEGIRLLIMAKDAVAFRATIESVTKLTYVYEKMDVL